MTNEEIKHHWNVATQRLDDLKKELDAKVEICNFLRELAQSVVYQRVTKSAQIFNGF